MGKGVTHGRGDASGFYEELFQHIFVMFGFDDADIVDCGT